MTDACRPRLIDRREALAGNVHFYLTLSYVWGRAQTYVLKSANLRHLRQGLDTALLPETLKDAINVTSQLGFNYIWIDAFCIIQDSDDDKAAELPQMPQIYQKSALTIFAASAASSERGFLNPPEVDGSYPPVEIRLDDGSSHGSSFLLGLTSTLAPLKDPIYDRAWTLQEQLLSPRLLLFENGGVSWECVECHITYQGAAARTEAHLLSLCRAADRRSDDSIYFRWAQIRGRYCYKNLTFFEDKLNALSAVASEISRATGWTYLAGLWKEHLLDDLLWCYRNRKDYWEVDPSEYPILKSAKARAAEHVAPSWSWASVAEGGIPDTGMGQERQWSEFKVLDCRIEPAGGGRFGSIKFGVLEVNGRVVELGFRFDFRPDMMSDGDIALIDEAKGTATDSVVGYGVTDPLDEPLAPDIGLHCLGVAKGVVFKRQVVEGLMLLPKGDGSFYRVGYFRAHQPRIFEHVPQRLLRII